MFFSYKRMIHIDIDICDPKFNLQVRSPAPTSKRPKYKLKTWAFSRSKAWAPMVVRLRRTAFVRLHQSVPAAVLMMDEKIRGLHKSVPAT